MLGTKRFLEIILPILVFTAVIILSLTFISNRISFFGINSFTVVTGSMEPKLPVGSVVLTKKTDEYKLGNILTFKRGNDFITHRIVGFKNGGLITKGDANTTIDSDVIAKTSVVGKDIFVIPYLGTFEAFFTSATGFFIFILLPIAAYLVLEAMLITAQWRKNLKETVLQITVN